MIKKVIGNQFAFLLSLAKVTDNPDGMVLLYNKGVEIGCIKPQTKDYWALRDVLKEYQWEDYPRASGYDYDREDNEYEYCILWVNDIAIKFDSFKVEWL